MDFFQEYETVRVFLRYDAMNIVCGYETLDIFQ